MQTGRSITFLIICFILLGCSNQQQAEQPTRPDILMIAVDDLNDWVGFLGGHPQAKTPNLDRLAGMGLVFERAYCAAPVCNPSRAALLTGVSPHRSGIYKNRDSLSRSPIYGKVATLPRYLSKHGYHTSGKGKLFHHMKGPMSHPDEWDDWQNPTGNSMGQHPGRKDGMLANGMPYQGVFQYGLDWASNNLSIEETQDYHVAKWAANELLKESEKPKFIAAGLFRPHLPWYVPQEYYDRFPIDEVIVPEINENDLDDLGKLAKQNSGGLKQDKDFQRIKKHGLQKEAVQAYLASMAYADDCLGILLEAILENPNKDNTILVLWGDHGWHLGEKLHYRKFTMWEEACRVPLIISVPGVTQPRTSSDKMVNLLDLYPTLVNLAGLPANPGNDGRNIAPLLSNPQLEWPYASVSFDQPNRSSVRTEKWRYILYEDGSEELYDHDTDSLEWNNLASNDQYAPVLEEMRRWIPGDFEPAVSKSTGTGQLGQDEMKK